MESTYKSLYFQLFNRITDAIAAMEQQNFGTAKEILIHAQQDAEERYLKQDTTIC